MTAAVGLGTDDVALLALRERYVEQLRILNGGEIAPLDDGEYLDLAGVARVMMDLDRRMGKLAALAAQLRAAPEGDGVRAARECDATLRLLRDEFHQGAQLLGVTSAMSPAEVRALVAKLETAARANEGP